MDTSYRSSASFGKRHEYIAVAKLLRENFDVYMTLVDDQGIDCVIRLNEKTYLDIQIKARSDNAKHPGYFANLKIPNPRKNYYFMFYSEPADHYWIIPSLDLVKLAHRQKGGKHKGVYTAILVTRLKSGDISYQQKYDKYMDNFEILRNHV